KSASLCLGRWVTLIAMGLLLAAFPPARALGPGSRVAARAGAPQLSRSARTLRPDIAPVGAARAAARARHEQALVRSQASSKPNTIRFAVIGDFGANSQSEADVAALVHSWNPDFITTNGDNNYPLGQSTTIDANVGQYYHDFIFPYLGSYGA